MARVTITLPDEVLKAADASARMQRRSRSWIVAEALRRQLRREEERGAAQSTQRNIARHGLDPSRLAQLEADLRLSPEERVREAEQTLRLSERTRNAQRNRVASFERYEDFMDWERSDSIR